MKEEGGREREEEGGEKRREESEGSREDEETKVIGGTVRDGGLSWKQLVTVIENNKI